jgi:hypothetical protein
MIEPRQLKLFCSSCQIFDIFFFHGFWSRAWLEYKLPSYISYKLQVTGYKSHVTNYKLQVYHSAEITSTTKNVICGAELQ